MFLAAIDLEALRWGALLMILLVVSIALHEFGHAWMADRRGDPLPRAQGRVTLDPLAHIDPIGTLLIPGLMIFWPVLFGGGAPIALIGWGKPVQILLPNPRTRHWDDILSTAAGPAMNLLLCVAFALGSATLLAFGWKPSATAADFLVTAIALNAGLLAFNLLPIPPLDGGRLLRRFTGMTESTFNQIATYAPFVLLLLINLGPFRRLLGSMVGWVAAPFLGLSGLLDH
jgi:Zn-dependent protease